MYLQEKNGSNLPIFYSTWNLLAEVHKKAEGGVPDKGTPLGIEEPEKLGLQSSI